ncbi:MAG: V-type ATP synthase subunit I [Clostridiales bacterium]|nr:V-type ATP synthase subunit I [Clostridiales bacterium]
MSKVRMKRIFICGLNSQKSQALDILQRAGTVEITAGDPEYEGLKRIDAGQEKAESLQKASQAEQAIAVLDEFAPEQTGLLDSLKGAEDIGTASYNDRAAHIEEYMHKAEELIRLSKQIAEHRAAIPKCLNRLEALKAWQGVDVPLDFSGTEKTRAFIGSVAQDVSAADIYGLLQNELGGNEPTDLEITQFFRGKMLSSFMAICHRDDGEAVENALRRINFVKAPSGTMIPAEEEAAIGREISEHESQIAVLSEAVGAYAGDRQDLKFAADYFRLQADRFAVSGKLAQTENAFFISGYTPEEGSEALKNRLEQLDAVVELAEPSEDEEVPVALKNGFLSEPMETVVESYSIPGKTEIDPSKIIACFYYILFGLMLSDAGYGLILVIACGYVLLKVKNIKPGMEKMVRLMFFSGISTTFWGFMFGSFFGDAVGVVASTFFNRPDIAFRPLWFNSMEEPIRLLAFAFLIGIIHLFTGLFIKLYQLLKAGQIRDAIYDVVFWMMFVGGAIIYLLSMQMITDMLSLSFILSPAIGKAGGMVAIAGCLGVVLTGGRESKNPIIRLLLGLYGAYGITSWLSDVLSYSRLLALGLATGCIAQVFNKLGTMLGNGILGAVFFIVIFVFGNLLNLAINVLGAYVHTNRLQFVEFFNKFYEGGGREFEPFTENTKYYSVKEEI